MVGRRFVFVMAIIFGVVFIMAMQPTDTLADKRVSTTKSKDSPRTAASQSADDHQVKPAFMRQRLEVLEDEVMDLRREVRYLRKQLADQPELKSEFPRRQAHQPVPDEAPELPRSSWKRILWDGAASSLEISGFGSVGYMNNLESSQSGQYELGDVTVDLGWSFPENVSLLVRTYFNQDEVALGPNTALEVADIDFLWGSSFWMGLIDIPVGIDLDVWDAPDRMTVSTPLVVDYMLDGGYMANGFAFGKGADQYRYILYSGNGQYDGLSYGGRLGLYVVPQVEVGGSLYQEQNGAGDRPIDRQGADFCFQYDWMEIRAEYLQGTDRYPLDGNDMAARDHSGYYAQPAFFFDAAGFPWVAAGRYGVWDPEYDANEDGNSGNDRKTEYTGFLGFYPWEFVRFGLECGKHENEDGSSEDHLEAQALVMF